MSEQHPNKRKLPASLGCEPRDVAACSVDFHSMVEAAPIGVTEIEPGTGRVLYANEAFRRMTGYSEHEFEDGKISFVELTHPDDHAQNIALHRQFLRGDILRYSMEKRYVRKDGAIFPVRVTASNLRRVSDGVWRSIGIVEDLSRERSRPVGTSVVACGSEVNIAPSIRRSARLIEELARAHPGDPLDIASVARAAGVSERAIYNRFKALGCTPSQYWKNLRLENARSQFQAASETTSVTGIAFANGFSNLGHFARDYRLAFGELPRDTLMRARELMLRVQDAS